MPAEIPPLEVRRLARQLETLRRDVDDLQRGAGTTQLPYSTLENGYLLVRDGDGNVRQILGRQNDGTFAQKAVNAPPPPKPDTPTLAPAMGGLTVHWNGELVEAIPEDFSHILIYLSPVYDFVPGPSNLIGTMTREGVFPTGKLPYEPHYCRIVAVNTSGKMSEPSNQSVPATPSRLLGSDLFPEIIDETHIAEDSIGTPELKANSVTALNILAEAIKAYHLSAGIIEAEHLAAVLILASRIVIGNPTADRLELDESGMTQYNEDGSPVMRFGRRPRDGNYLTVVDPDDPYNALASISDQGVISASGFTVTGPLKYEGYEMSEYITEKSNGVVAYGQLPASGEAGHGIATSETGLMELSVPVVGGRIYEIHTGTIIARDARADFRIHYTTDGSTPMVGSPRLTQSPAQIDLAANGMNALVAIPPGATRLRLLLSFASLDAGVATKAVTFGANGLIMWVNDLGLTPQELGIPSDGGGTTPAPPQQYNVHWPSIWTGCWNQHGKRFGNGQEMVQGFYPDGFNGDNRSAIGFDLNQVRADLAGATIDSVGLYLYSRHWYYNSGGYARIGTHSSDVYAPINYPGTSPRVKVQAMEKPQGLWILLPIWVGEQIRDGLVGGFTLDATDVPRNLVDYGRFDGQGMANAPILGIRFTK